MIFTYVSVTVLRIYRCKILHIRFTNLSCKTKSVLTFECLTGRSPRQDILYEIILSMYRVNTLGSKICFLWVPAHVGVVGNEEVDHLKEALKWSYIEMNIALCKEEVKGIVHPKMKILSSFTHPQVVPNLYECLCSAEHKGRYSEEWGKQSSSGAPLTSIVFFPLLWKSMVPQNSLVTNFLQNIFLCVQQNKDIHTGLEQLEGE